MNTHVEVGSGQTHPSVNQFKSETIGKIDLGDAKQPLKFFKFDPNDVYGSYQVSELKDKTLDPGDTPVAHELMNPNRKVSNDMDIFGVKEEKDDSDSKENLDPNAFINLGIYSFTHPLREEGLKEEGCTDESHVNMFFCRQDLKNIEVVRLRAYFGYYHKLQPLYEDIMTLLKYTLSERCKNVLAKYYISNIMYKVHTLFRDRRRADEFHRLYKEDFDYKFTLNELLKAQGKWSKEPGPQRKYISVREYVPVTNDPDTLTRLDTKKTSKCSGD